MRRRWAAVVGLLVLIVCISQSNSLVAADDRIVVRADTFRYEFGQALYFHLEADSPLGISQALLSYGPVGNSSQFVVQPAFTPGSHVLLDYVHDLSALRFQAFGVLEYYWVVIDSRGLRQQTKPVRFSYQDNRFQWNELADDGVTVAWYGNRAASFGGAALYDAQRARSRIAADTGGDPKQPVHLYIYSTPEDLQAAAQVSRQEWIVGQAYPRTATCLVVIPDNGGYASQMERVIPHEVSHLLVGDLAFGLPRWLDEGLATDNEGVPDPRSDSALTERLKSGDLLRFEQLCAQFPADPQLAALAYDQSRSLVAYIRNRHGLGSLSRLIAAYQDTHDCQIGLQAALGLTLPQLQAEWESSLPRPAALGGAIRTAGPWLGLWLGSCLVTLLALPSVAAWWNRRRERL